MTETRNWTHYNAAQSEEKRRFVALLADLCGGVPTVRLPGAGRPRLPLKDMLFAAAYKVYVGFSARRFTSDLRDAFVSGQIDSTPHFNSVNRYMANPELTDALKALVTASSLPLKSVETDFAVDSSGFGTSRFVRWYNKKYGREVDNRTWIKCHLMCGVKTKIVTSVASAVGPPTTPTTLCRWSKLQPNTSSSGTCWRTRRTCPARTSRP